MFDRIDSDPTILGGKPIIKGTRISVEFITSKNTSNENRVFAQYMLARWRLSQKDAREFREHRLKDVHAGAELRYPTEQEYLQTLLLEGFSTEKVAVMAQEAVASLELLSESESPVRQPFVTGLDENWIIIRVDSDKMKSTSRVTDLAAALLFKEKHLQFGRPAPDLDVDLVNGKRWSLAQQRGKTVIIIFSFKGCGPCERMYPDLKTLDETFSDSLSILSIMLDKDKSDTIEAVESGKLTWNVCWDGQGGPIMKRWAVQSCPTIYVVGPDGRIAGYGLSGESLKFKIAELTSTRPK